MAVPVPASTAEALAMVRAGMDYLAAADPAAMSARAQAECLVALEHSDAVETAARARILAAFTAGQGYAEDADYSPASWLIHRTRVTKGAARGHLGWAHRAAAHPQIAVALAEGAVLTESMAIHQWGWQVTFNPDGTTTARSPDGTKILHSHSPPTARAG